MSRASIPRLQKKGILPPTPPPVAKRNFRPEEVLELQEMHRIVSARKFEAAQIGGNTSLVPRGQEIFKEIEAIARLLENAKNHYVSQKLSECGYANGTNVSINLSSGEITVNPVDNPTPQK